MSSETDLERQFRDADIFFPPNLAFRGAPKNVDGSALSRENLHFLKWMIAPVAQATEQIVLPQPDRFNVGKSSISPRTIVNFTGQPNAAARLRGPGEIEINVGMLFAFNALPSVTEVVYSLLRRDHLSLTELQAFDPPPAALNEIDALVNAWSKSAESGWREMYLPPSATKTEVTPHYFSSGMVYIVVGHELTHWFETIYKRAEWSRMMNETESHIRVWLKKERMLDARIVRNAKRLLRDRSILENWKREIHADHGAFSYLVASGTHSGWITSTRILMDAYTQIAFFFGLLTLLEAFGQAHALEFDISTHPPAIIRRAMFCHIEATKYSMSQPDFMSKQFGAGMAVAFILETIMRRYFRGA